jgi:hypothetical protein
VTPVLGMGMASILLAAMALLVLRRRNLALPA